jgi:hypothetical protein
MGQGLSNFIALQDDSDSCNNYQNCEAQSKFACFT